jgi:hypothetical protein
VRSRRVSGIGVVLSLILLAVGASPAAAVFTRTFVRQITSSEAPTGLVCTGSQPPCLRPEGLAVNGADDLWVGSGETHNALDEFSSASLGSEALGAFPVESFTFPESLADEHATGRLYVTGENRTNSESLVEVFDEAGTKLEQWPIKLEGHPYIAVDNSTDPLEDPSACDPGCTVYVVANSLQPSVSKFDAKGDPAPFTAVAPYIQGNHIIGVPETGTPCTTTTFVQAVPPGAVATDAKGHIFVVDLRCDGGEAAVLEYDASGQFVHAFTGENVPPLEEDDAFGFGGAPKSITVDPSSGHLLLALDGEHEGGVDEFDIASGVFLAQIREVETEPSSGVRHAASLEAPFALSADSEGNVYVSDPRVGSVDVYSPGRFLPSFTLDEPTERRATSAELSGSVSPEGLSLANCEFQYVTEEAFAKEGFTKPTSVPCHPSAAEIDGGDLDATVAVEATISPLVSGVTYRYRLSATSEGALGGTATSEVLAFTAPHAPLVSAESASNISSTFVDLSARVIPEGASTSYYFEYVDDAHFSEGATDPYAAGKRVPLAPAPLGEGGPSGNSVENVLQHVGGLHPGTGYHYRVVAENSVDGAAQVTAGEDEQFTTLPTTPLGLPDGRSYELVTPPEENKGSDMFAENETNGEYSNRDVGDPAETGDGFILQTKAALGSFSSAGESMYVFARKPAGWTFTSLASPALGVQSIENPLFDPADLSRVALNDVVGASVTEAGARETTLVGAPGGPYTELHADQAFHSLTEPQPIETTKVTGGARDLSRVVLESTRSDTTSSICPSTPTVKHGRALCEWTVGAPSGLRPVAVTSEEASVSACGAALGSGAIDGQARTAVSSDGSRTVFTAPDPLAKGQGTGCWSGNTHTPQLYMRARGDTVKLSEAQSGVIDPTGEHPATFVGASEDGSRVYFLSESWLTSDHPEAHDRELYECRILEEASTGPSCELSRVSAGDGGSVSGASGAGVFNVPAVATTGAAVYFTALGGLAPGATALSPTGELVNVYRFDTATKATTFVATVNTYDYPDSVGGCTANASEAAVGPCNAAQWYSTPDGSRLLFATSRELTGFKTVGACATLPDNQGVGNGRCDELYRYDAAGRALTCVSCDPSGAAPVSDAQFARSFLTGASAPPVRGMSDDGSFVFFDTADALVPGDGNGTLDVYEWHDGAVSLISSGTSAAPSFFLGSGPSGSDVFVGTHEQLVRQDTNSTGDIYDARICGPSSCIGAPTRPPVACEGDACLGPAAPQLEPRLVTLSPSGEGNITPVPSSKPSAPAKPLTRAQLLTRALAKCRKVAAKKRAACRRRAKAKYGPVAKHKSKKASRPAAKKGGRR